MTLPLVGISLRTCVLWMYTDINPTPYLNLVMSSFGLGSVLAPIIYDSIKVRALEYIFYSLAGVCFALGVVAPLLRGPPGQQKEHHLPSRRGSRRGSMPSSRSVTIDFALLTLMLGIGVGAEATVGSFLYSLASTGHHKHGVVTSATMMNSALWLTLTASRLIIIPISKSWKERSILRVANFVAAVGLLVPAIISAASGTSDPYPPSVLWLLTLTVGMGISANFPCSLGFGKKVLGRNYSALMNAIIALGANAGNGAFPAIASALSGCWCGEDCVRVDAPPCHTHNASPHVLDARARRRRGCRRGRSL